jgi:hypothetical protein
LGVKLFLLSLGLLAGVADGIGSGRELLLNVTEQVANLRGDIENNKP